MTSSCACGCGTPVSGSSRRGPLRFVRGHNARLGQPWPERLAAGIVIDPTTGCHLWTRSRNRKGYGTMSADGVQQLTHRLAFLLEHGRWPATGMVVDHICNTPACCNPAHLRELTNGANIQRAYPRGDAATEERRREWRERKAASRARRSV